MTKTCFKCGRVLPIEEFYCHPAMADGHLNKCRECARADVRLNRRQRIGHYRQYDRDRNDDLKRAAARRAYQQKQRRNEPLKYHARTMAGNAVRDGHIRREPCHFCGSTDRLEMHHPDYRFPLRVYWLCIECHRKLDNMHKVGSGGDIDVA